MLLTPLVGLEEVLISLVSNKRVAQQGRGCRWVCKLLCYIYIFISIQLPNNVTMVQGYRVTSVICYLPIKNLNFILTSNKKTYWLWRLCINWLLSCLVITMCEEAAVDMIRGLSMSLSATQNGWTVTHFYSNDNSPAIHPPAGRFFRVKLNRHDGYSSCAWSIEKIFVISSISSTCSADLVRPRE